MDDSVGEMMDRLKKSDFDENTTVVFISHNGGDAAENNGPSRGQKTNLFQGRTARSHDRALARANPAEESGRWIRHNHGFLPHVPGGRRHPASIGPQTGWFQSPSGAGRKGAIPTY